MLSVFDAVASFATLADAVKANVALGNKHTVVLSLSRFKAYGLLIKPSSIVRVPKTMCLLEMVVNNTGRPCLDFDTDVEGSLHEVEKAIKEYYLREYGLHATTSWKWSRGDRRTWHCVVAGMYYKKCWREGCLRMVESVLSVLPGLELDKGIYRSDSSLRMVGQYKYVEEKFCRELVPLGDCDIEDLCISPAESDVYMDNETLGVPAREPCTIRPWHRDLNMLTGFKIGKLMYTSAIVEVYRLDRLFPSHCDLCQRVHERENAMMIASQYGVKIKCFRDMALGTNGSGARGVKSQSS